ncbi:GNAT family N-acetyltransferase [Albidovulum aquaemixtae]|uniref:GNAT family N-acetyltransferase n=1 Tax=Albidovulum aquaemixtae TaxID=1542388 RepID=UPI0015E81D5D|nr:GNAT family N-acetyltransferase [Defluviimonas aquaemixtae]
MSAPSIRPVRPEDGDILLELIDIASHGFVMHLFGGATPPGQDVSEFTRSRIRSEDSGLSHTKSWVAEVDGEIAGYLAIDTVPLDPGPIPEDEPAMFRALTELEREAPGTGLINLLSTLPEMRGRGVGSALLHFSERNRGPNGMCLTVSDENVGAQRLYRRHGYRVAGRRPIVKGNWDTPAEEWLLMVKS